MPDSTAIQFEAQPARGRPMTAPEDVNTMGEWSR